MTIYQDSAAPGQVLMDRDRSMLEAASSGGPDTIVRFYRWDVPTISLGYHQQPELLELDRLAASETPWVRRPTGGAAVLHSDELTYSIVVAAANEGMTSRVHEFVGRAITQGLQAIGVDATLEPRGEPLSALPNRTTCFARTSRWEVTVQGRKIVGSAQRKLGNALLQHGSILMGPDHLRIVDFLRLKAEHERELMRGKLASRSTSIRQELGRVVDETELRAAMEASFRRWIPELLQSDSLRSRTIP